MVAVPKLEYLFKTTSSLGETASFGLYFGEIYKRSVVGVRVYGVPAGEKEKQPMAYDEAAALAETNARSDSGSYRRHLRFLPRGIRIGEAPDNSHLYDYTHGGKAD